MIYHKWNIQCKTCTDDKNKFIECNKMILYLYNSPNKATGIIFLAFKSNSLSFILNGKNSL